MVVWSRNYILDGNSIATELVSPADGTFSSITVRSPDKHKMEIFKRNEDGSVKPANTAEIDSVNKGKGVD
jgi:hypothetical protein